MKTSFLSILLFALATTASAQKFEFGLNGGLANYSIHNFYSGSAYQDFTHFQSSVIAPVISLRAMYNYKKYQAGIALEYRTLTYKCYDYPDFMNGSFIAPVVQFTGHETPVRLFVNRLFQLKKITAYGGLSVAYILVTTKGKVIVPSTGADYGTQNTTRLAGGLQMGATYFITKHIGINAEVSGEYNNFPSGPLDKNVFSYPVTLGVRYKL